MGAKDPASVQEGVHIALTRLFSVALKVCLQIQQEDGFRWCICVCCFLYWQMGAQLLFASLLPNSPCCPALHTALPFLLCWRFATTYQVTVVLLLMHSGSLLLGSVWKIQIRAWKDGRALRVGRVCRSCLLSTLEVSDATQASISSISWKANNPYFIQLGTIWWSPHIVSLAVSRTLKWIGLLHICWFIIPKWCCFQDMVCHWYQKVSQLKWF